ncbi:MAG: hypothetical protein JRJ87_26585 [Deltaproteobacteria bacterium]|nr:hypothetical protein [Deltaproteobacteria bacterium]
MSKKMKLAVIEVILKELLYRQSKGRKTILIDIVYGAIKAELEETVGTTRKELCERFEKRKWVKVGAHGDAIVTPEGVVILEKIEMNEDLDRVIAEWEGGLAYWPPEIARHPKG